MQCFVIYSQIYESKCQPTEYNEELVNGLLQGSENSCVPVKK